MKKLITLLGLVAFMTTTTISTAMVAVDGDQIVLTDDCDKCGNQKCEGKCMDETKSSKKGGACCAKGKEKACCKKGNTASARSCSKGKKKASAKSCTKGKASASAEVKDEK